MGNLNNDSNLDLGGIIQGISFASNSFDLGSITEGVGQLIGDTPTTLTNLSDLLQGNSNLGEIDLSNIIPGITESLPQPLASSTLSGYDATTLPSSIPSLELEQPIVFG